MKTLPDSTAPSGQRPSRLIVMLPGAYNLPQDFVDQGFIAELRQRDLAADILMADVHFAYFADRTAVSRIHDEIIAPARARGYHDIWIIGISLGGFGALAYAAEHANQISGIFVIAPFPGTADILKEIRSLGGPLSWSQTAAAQQGDERVIWRWLAGHHRSSAPQPAVYFGTAEGDRYINGQRMLAELVPASHCWFVAGDHSWPAWQALWRNFLDHGPWREEAKIA